MECQVLQAWANTVGLGLEVLVEADAGAGSRLLSEWRDEAGW